MSDPTPLRPTKTEFDALDAAVGAVINDAGNVLLKDGGAVIAAHGSNGTTGPAAALTTGSAAGGFLYDTSFRLQKRTTAEVLSGTFAGQDTIMGLDSSGRLYLSQGGDDTPPEGTPGLLNVVGYRDEAQMLAQAHSTQTEPVLRLNTSAGSSIFQVGVSGAITSTGAVNGASPTELGYLSGVTSAVQTQLDSKSSQTVSSSAPTADDDAGSGYGQGHLWYETDGVSTVQAIHTLLDSTDTSAMWRQIPILNSSGNLEVSGVIVQSDTAALLTLDANEIGIESDTGTFVVGDGINNVPVGPSSLMAVDVVAGPDFAANGAKLTAGLDLAVERFFDQTPAAVTFIDDGVIIAPIIESSFNVDSTAGIEVGDVLTWGTDGSGSGAFDDTAFSGEWMLVTGISGSTLSMTRGYNGSTAAAIADQLDLYILRKSNPVLLRVWGGSYDMSAEDVLEINHPFIKMSGPEGPDVTKVFKNQADSTPTELVKFSGTSPLEASGIHFNLRNDNAATVASGSEDTAVLLETSNLTLSNMKFSMESDCIGTPYALFGITDSESDANKLSLSDTSVVGNMGLELGADADFKDFTLSGSSGDPISVVGGTGTYSFSRVDASCAGVFFDNDSGSGQSLVVYDSTIVATSGTTTFSLLDDDSVSAAHNRLSHEFSNTGGGSNSTLSDWNDITTGYNVVDSDVI